jgi:hypothetical protein
MCPFALIYHDLKYYCGFLLLSLPHPRQGRSGTGVACLQLPSQGRSASFLRIYLLFLSLHTESHFGRRPCEFSIRVPAAPELGYSHGNLSQPPRWTNVSAYLFHSENPLAHLQFSTKAVANGALAWHLDSSVSARINKYHYGTDICIPWAPADPEVNGRPRITDPSGGLVVNGGWSSIVAKVHSQAFILDHRIRVWPLTAVIIELRTFESHPGTNTSSHTWSGCPPMPQISPTNVTYGCTAGNSLLVL